MNLITTRSQMENPVNKNEDVWIIALNTAAVTFPIEIDVHFVSNKIFSNSLCCHFKNPFIIP